MIPGLLLSFVALHLLMVIKLGINDWPMPGRVVRKATYIRDYHHLTATEGAPFVPYAVWKDMFFAAFVLIAVAACAVYFGPFGPSGVPDPTIIQTAPKPDYFFLWLYALLSLFAAVDGNAGSLDWPSGRHRRIALATIPLWRR